MAGHRAVIIGAGFGGLAAALDLAAAGVEVLVVERGHEPGGKARRITLGDRSIDTGPTVLTMKWVWAGWGEAWGAPFASMFEPLDPIARHAFHDGSVLDLFADRARSVDAIGQFAGAAEARRYVAFCESAERIWSTVRGPFVLSQKPSLADVARHTARHGLSALLRIDAHRTMAKALEGAFVDPRLRQLFGRYATYCGGSPYDMPATYNLVAHVESEGVSRVRGGISALAHAMAERAERAGAAFRYGADVERVVFRGGRAAGVVLATGETIEADAVVMNGDVSALRLLGAPKAAETAREDRTLSAFTIAMAAETAGFALAPHTVFFSADYAKEWRDLARGFAPDPTVYVHTNGEGALFFVLNAPANGDEPDRWSASEKDRWYEAALSKVSRAGLSLAPSHVVSTSPADYAARFPATGGALYGPKAQGAMSSLSRAGSRTKVPRLYLAGGSVHPGPGVPMATLSGRFAAESVLADLASIGPSRGPVINGITSTA